MAKDQQQRAHYVLETIYDGLITLDRYLQTLEIMRSDLNVFSAQDTKNTATQAYIFDAWTALGAAESALLSARRSMEGAGYQRCIVDANKDASN